MSPVGTINTRHAVSGRVYITWHSRDDLAVENFLPILAPHCVLDRKFLLEWLSLTISMGFASSTLTGSFAPFHCCDSVFPGGGCDSFPLRRPDSGL